MPIDLSFSRSCGCGATVPFIEFLRNNGCVVKLTSDGAAAFAPPTPQGRWIANQPVLKATFEAHHDRIVMMLWHEKRGLN